MLKNLKLLSLEGKIDRKNLRYVCGWGAKNFDDQKDWALESRALHKKSKKISENYTP